MISFQSVFSVRMCAGSREGGRRRPLLVGAHTSADAAAGRAVWRRSSVRTDCGSPPSPKYLLLPRPPHPPAAAHRRPASTARPVRRRDLYAATVSSCASSLRVPASRRHPLRRSAAQCSNPPAAAPHHGHHHRRRRTQLLRLRCPSASLPLVQGGIQESQSVLPSALKLTLRHGDASSYSYLWPDAYR
eukprot:SAG11_NODE_916_length_6555_cov_5.026332_5_plen_188_part_00